jgi:hypothetical protein
MRCYSFIIRKSSTFLWMAVLPFRWNLWLVNTCNKAIIFNFTVFKSLTSFGTPSRSWKLHSCRRQLELSMIAGNARKAPRHLPSPQNAISASQRICFWISLSCPSWRNYNCVFSSLLGWVVTAVKSLYPLHP